MQKSSDFYEIYDYYYQPLYQRGSFQLAFLFLFLFILAIITFFVVRYILRKRREIMLSPWELALKQLMALPVGRCATKKDFKKFYFDLTFIMKRYFAKRYVWKVEDKTDEELIAFLQDKKYDPTLLEKFKGLAKEAVWIKFANEAALKVQAKKDLDLAVQIVQQTIPAQEPKNK